MKCEDCSMQLLAYLERRANSAERREVEGHLAACSACRTRAEEFRKVWNVLEELPAHEPSFAFDSKVRQRVAAEPERGWLRWFVPQPRLAFSVALLAALTVWMARLPQNPTRSLAGAPTEEEKFQMIDHLGVLENFDVLSNSEVLSELPPQTRPEAAPQDKTERPQGDGG